MSNKKDVEIEVKIRKSPKLGGDDIFPLSSPLLPALIERTSITAAPRGRAFPHLPRPILFRPKEKRGFSEKQKGEARKLKYAAAAPEHLVRPARSPALSLNTGRASTTLTPSE
jgi:hypothetical protein